MTAPRLIEWGVATLALPGEAQSGDRHLVKPVGSTVLVAVVDGLGHGAEAAPQQLADQILARHGKGTDDALVLVARYLGGAGTRG